MDVVVRRIERGDGPCLKEIRLRALAEAPYAFASTYAREAALDDEEWADRAERWSDGRTSIAYVAQWGDDRVGLVAAFLDEEANAHLVSMWCSPNARRLGVGRALVEAVLAWAVSIGAPEVQLWVARDNEGAQAFYRTMGFEPLPGYRPLPSDPCRDEFRMRRRLAVAGPAGGAQQGGDDGDDHGHPEEPAQRSQHQAEH